VLNAVRQLVGRAGAWLQRASAGLSLSQTWLLLGRSGSSKYDVDSPMAKVTTVYSGIMAIAQTLSGLPMSLHTGDPERPLTSGPAVDLLWNPSPGETWRSLCEQVAGHLIESGETFVFPVDGQWPARQLLVTGRRRMEPELRGGRLLWWWFTDPMLMTRTPVLPEDMGMRRLFNPYDWRGLSPLKAAAMEIKQSWLAGTFNAAALMNGARPGGVYSVPGQLTEDEKKELRTTIKERHESPENAGRPLLGWGGLDYKDVSGSLADLQLAELKKLSREDILAALGVPPVLAGIFESAHYDVADQAIIIFLIHKLGPLARAIEDMFTLQLLPRIQPGVKLSIDTTAHPAMLKIVASKIDAMKKAIDNGTPYNEAAPLVGLKLKPQSWGDRSLVPGGLSPIEDVLAGGTGLTPDEGDEETKRQRDEVPDETKDEKPSDAHVQRETAAAIAVERREEERLVRAHVPRFRNAMRAHFARQQRTIIARLARAMKDSQSGALDHSGWVAPWERAADENERIAAKVLLDVSEEAKKLKLLVRNTFPATVEAALREKLAAMGWEKDAIDKAVKRLIEGKTVRGLVRIKEGKIAGIERVTRERVKKQIVEGLSKGENITEISDRVRKALGGTDASRALTIARTEVGQAVSTGRHLAAQTAGVQAKSWITGANPRATHELAGLEYGPGAPIPIDRPFKVGASSLMYPRDPTGEPGEIINCNCVEVPRRLKAAS
jgi:HK97 family phage portal protein